MDRLFDPGPPVLPPAAQPERLSSDRRRTLRNAVLIALGVHPATRLPVRADAGTCGTCRHAVSVSGGARRWWKCDLRPATHGPATDIRVGWPACTRHEKDDLE